MQWDGKCVVFFLMHGNHRGIKSMKFKYKLHKRGETDRTPQVNIYFPKTSYSAVYYKEDCGLE